MYEDTYRGKPRKKRRRRSGCLGGLIGLLVRLILFVLLLALIAAGVLYLLPVSFANVERGESDLSLTDGLPTSRTNVLLLGLDYMENEMQRSDAVLIASFGRDSVRLTSVQRDLEVDVPGHGKQKVNAAYAFGVRDFAASHPDADEDVRAAAGAGMTMRLLNQALDLNITSYIVVDFSAMVDIVDAVGGIDIEIAADEIGWLNRYAGRTFNAIMPKDPAKYEHLRSSRPIEQAGMQHLSGIFAVGYSRIRYVGTDVTRAYRQRKVLTALADSVRKNCWKPGMYIRLMDVLTHSVKTNLSIPELISLGEKVALGGSIETDSSQRIPYADLCYDQYDSGKGSNLEISDRTKTVERLHAYIYG